MYIHLYNTYRLTHVHAYTYVRYMDPCVCVIKPVGCGTSQKYTKYRNLQCKILQIFYKNSIINHLHP